MGWVGHGKGPRSFRLLRPFRSELDRKRLVLVLLRFMMLPGKEGLGAT